MNISNMFDGDMRGERYEQLLDRMGLQRKNESSSMMLSSIGLFGMGIAVGAAMGMLFAPKEGAELRSQAMNKMPMPGKGSQKGNQDTVYEQRA